jgi:integrase
MASTRKRTWTSRGIEHSKWVVDYFDQAGTRRLKTFATKREANAWAVTALHEVKTGTHTASSASITIAEAGDMWIKQNETDGLERSTVRQRRQHIELHINPFLGRVKLADLTAPRVYAFANELRAAGRSAVMCKKIVTNLKTILSFAQRRGLVAQNVALAVRVGNKADARHEEGPLRAGVDFPSRAELKALIEAAAGRWRPFLIVAIFTGMRASELRGLPWRDVDLEHFHNMWR